MLLVVLLIIMIATASAMLALHTVHAELRATGNQRLALQTRAVADAAMVTTIAWVESTAGSDLWLDTHRKWNRGEIAPPPMGEYPEPEINPLTTRGFATRSTMAAQRELNVDAANEVGIVCDYGGGASGSGGAGGGGGAGGAGGSSSSTNVGCNSSFDQANLVGSFGPQQAYGLPNDGYEVDLTDCFKAPAAMTPGSPLGEDTSFEVIAFICTVTARGRLDIAATTRSWDRGSSPAYTQRVFASANDARATVVTPEMIVPK